jgi:hypothetical protein
MEERTGLAGRKMLEKFLNRLDKLERGLATTSSALRFSQRR